MKKTSGACFLNRIKTRKTKVELLVVLLRLLVLLVELFARYFLRQT
jgi:hypothetical protein